MFSKSQRSVLCFLSRITLVPG